MITINNLQTLAGKALDPIELPSQDKQIIDAKGAYALPGAIDPHVHFRIPGQAYKEDWTTAARAAINGGYTVHVGTDDAYVAVYTGPDGGKAQTAPHNNYLQRGGLNHIGIVVDDLDAVEAKVKALGLETHNHGDYEPGRRFYFHDETGMEFEVVAYD